MAKKAIGPSFSYELAAAGLLGLPFTRSPDGVIAYGEVMTDAQQAAVEAVYAAHDPTKMDVGTIKAQLAELDGKSIRALHEAVLALAASGTALPASTVDRLQELEKQKETLRAQLATQNQ